MLLQRCLWQARPITPAFVRCVRSFRNKSSSISAVSLSSGTGGLRDRHSAQHTLKSRLCGCRHRQNFIVICSRQLAGFNIMELKGRVIVYSIVGCPHCMAAKNTLQELSLPYTDISLDTHPQCREEVQARTGRRTVPQIFFNAVHVGGNDDLQQLVKDKDRYEKLLDEIKNNPPPEDAPKLPKEAESAAKDSEEFVCEPDEYAQLVQDLKMSGIIGDHRKGLSTLKNSFKGKDFVDWVVREKKLEREQAVEMGQNLLNKHFGHELSKEQVFSDSEELYRLLEDDESNALNAGEMSTCDPLPAGQLGEMIRKAILKVYSTYLSPDGKAVDYKGMGKSAEFQEYVRLTKELQRVKIEDANREEKLSFFTNVYNALVIHANVVRGPPTNLWQRYKFFNTVRYIIGGQTYSLQDIENGVLRANRKGVGQLFRPFSKTDPRLQVALERHEPLIHFGLVCGAKSCPPIKTYTAADIYKELTLACEAFLEGDDGCMVDVNAGRVKLSQIFKWYREDFGKNDAELVAWVAKHMATGEKKQQLEQLMQGKYKVAYLPYDWSPNAKS